MRYATDASPYRLFPKVVIIAQNVEDVRKTLAYARRCQESVTFRAAGTSLSGQAQGDGILIDVRRHWAGVEVEGGGRRLRARPGTILARANLALHPHGYRLGPDPASASACTIGGVVANNSSGMCCGTTQNSYKTLSSLSFMLPSGAFIDTAKPDAEREFAAAEPALAAGLMEIKREIEADPELTARLRKKFSIKNTTGYHMEAFLDGSTPLEIFRRLIVGSEGTLAFIAEAVFETLPDDQYRLTSFMIFPDMHAACAAVKPFVDHGAAAVELVDRASLRSVEGKPGVPERWKTLPENATGLLVEFRAPSEAARAEAERTANATLAGMSLLEPAAFTRDPALAAQFWTVRSGLLPSVGGARPPGSSFILEDVCFPPERLADGALDLQALFGKHGYEGIVFGHASAGNLHFLITPFLNDPKEIERYGAFMADVVDLVVGKYDGSLKAEHGTGRNVAPFVEREWGARLAALMWKLKRLADPENMLSPGVLLSKDPHSHLDNLQTAPIIETTVDRCIQCGFCEPVCPSRNLTTTPRQRIALRREMARQPEGSPVTGGLLADYDYDAIQTCAGDGSCSIACPVDINTGALMKHFRHLEHSLTAERVAAELAKRFGAVERAARLGMGAANGLASVLGAGAVTALTDMARAAVSKELVPQWLPNMPPAARARLPATKREGAVGVYFTACVNRIFGRTASRERRLVSAGGDGRSLGARWLAPVDSGRHHRALLCYDLALEGLCRGQRRHGEPRRRSDVALERRRPAADRLRCELVLARSDQRNHRVSDAAEPRAPRQADDLQLDRLGARSPLAEAPRPAQGRRGGASPDVFGQSPQAGRQAQCARRRPCRHGGDAGCGRLLRVRGRPRHAPRRIDALGDCRGGGGGA